MFQVFSVFFKKKIIEELARIREGKNTEEKNLEI
jgi:hypothetical protein